MQSAALVNECLPVDIDMLAGIVRNRAACDFLNPSGFCFGFETESYGSSAVTFDIMRRRKGEGSSRINALFRWTEKKYCSVFG